MRAAAPGTRQVVDQTVVSVGPYMLCSAAGGASCNCSTSAAGSASPPSRRWSRPPSARRADGSAASNRAMVGGRWEGGEAGALELLGARGSARRRRLGTTVGELAQGVEVPQAGEHRFDLDAEVDQAGHLVDADLLEPFHQRQAGVRSAEQGAGIEIELVRQVP